MDKYTSKVHILITLVNTIFGAKKQKHAKIVFFNKQINICWFKYELRGFYDFTLRNIAIS